MNAEEDTDAHIQRRNKKKTLVTRETCENLCLSVCLYVCHTHRSINVCVPPVSVCVLYSNETTTHTLY